MASREQQIEVTLRPSVNGKDPSDPVEAIFQKIQKIRESVAALREENTESECLQDQYTIHLQQCQEDHNILRRIYRKLKRKLDLAVSGAEVGKCVNQDREGPVEQPVVSANGAPMARRMAKLENVKLEPLVNGHNRFPDTSVRLRYALNTSTVICTSQFSPDASKIAFADANFLYIIQAEDGEIISTIQREGSGDARQVHPKALRFSPDSRLIAVSGAVNDVSLYDVESGKLVKTYVGHAKEVSTMVFNSDGSWLVTGGFDGHIIVWDTRTHTQVKTLSHSADEAIIGIATTPDVPFYAIGFSSGALGIYNPEFEQPMMTFAAHRNNMMGLAVSTFDDIDTIATVSQDLSVKIWQVRGVASCKHTLEGHTDIVLTVTCSRQDPIMITGSKDQTIKMWNHKTGAALFTLSAHKNMVFEISHHPTQRSFVSCGGDGLVCVWDYDELV